MAAFGKSALWLIGCGGLGYLLLEVTANASNEEYLSKVRKTYPGVEKSPVETLKQKQQFVDVLKAIAETNKPLHRLNKEEIEKLRLEKK